MKIKHREIPEIRERIAIEQGGICPLCLTDLEEALPSLDHDHGTGIIRGVLCRNCNQVEGRVTIWVHRGKRKQVDKESYLQRMLDYWKLHTTDQTGLVHPTHGKPKRRRRRKKRVKV